MALAPVKLTDPLTRLPNRESFFSRLPEIISAEGKFKSTFGLLVVDIRRFHRINRIFGFEIGNIILQKLTDLLNSVRRPQDHLFRIGDNRFAMILMDLMNVGHAELAAQKIQRLLEPPFIHGEDKVSVDCTIGVMMFPDHAITTEGLLKGAEEVLHEARLNGQKIGIAQKEKHVESELSEYWDIELGLQTAIERQELQLYYQPQVSMDSGNPVGAEALIRWIHPLKGMIAPDLFIPIAEQTGHITEITNWLLNAAMRDACDWTDKWGPLTVSVNIPADFLLRPFLKDFVASALKLWGSDTVTLVLEITERSLIKDTDKCFKVLTEIRDMGVRVSIDDFGTGYSTLSYFQHIPVDELKIDQSFVFDILGNKANQNIVRLITDLAHSFELEVVAEGVENLPVLTKVKSYGVDIAQGYHYAKPMPSEEFQQWLLDFHSRVS